MTNAFNEDVWNTVEHGGGTIELSSQVGVGSTFVVTLLIANILA